MTDQSHAANSRDDPCGDCQPHEDHTYNVGEYVYHCGGDCTCGGYARDGEPVVFDNSHCPVHGPLFAKPPASSAASVSEIQAVFVLSTAPQEGHSHPAYTHRCDVTLFGEPMWSRWGKTPEDAEKAARFEVKSRVRRSLRA